MSVFLSGTGYVNISLIGMARLISFQMLDYLALASINKSHLYQPDVFDRMLNACGMGLGTCRLILY